MIIQVADRPPALENLSSIPALHWTRRATLAGAYLSQVARSSSTWAAYAAASRTVPTRLETRRPMTIYRPNASCKGRGHDLSHTNCNADYPIYHTPIEDEAMTKSKNNTSKFDSTSKTAIPTTAGR